MRRLVAVVLGVLGLAVLTYGVLAGGTGAGRAAGVVAVRETAPRGSPAPSATPPETAFPTPVPSEPFSVHITAQVEILEDPDDLLGDSINVGDTITGVYTYDLATPNTNSHESSSYRGAYHHTEAPYGVILHAGDFIFESDPEAPRFYVDVTNDPPISGWDTLYLESYDNLPLLGEATPWWISVRLSDPTGTALSSHDLPDAAPELNDWASSTVIVRSEGKGGAYYIEASLTSAEAGPIPTPHPTRTATPTATPCPPDGCPTATPTQTWTPRPTPTPDGSMAVDCDARAAGVQASCSHPVGSDFSVQLHVLEPPRNGYVAFQTNLRLPDGLDYVPANEPEDEALWEECDIAVRSIRPATAPHGPYVLSGCMPFPFPEEHLFDTGAMVQLQFTCLTAGEAELGLQEFDDIGPPGSYFNNANLMIVDSWVADASVTCLPDTDSDGCADGQELGVNALSGGQRDPKHHWDFFDTPGADGGRDRQVSILDIGGVVARFGASGDAEGDPLAEPPAIPAYHSAFDRGGQAGANAWNLAPADGIIAIGDIGAVVAQFGHSCM